MNSFSLRYNKIVLRLVLSIFLFIHCSMPLQLYGQSSSSAPFVIKGEDTGARSGSVYLTSNKKNEVLFKMSIWGNVQYPGVHYLPLGTRFLEALSIAGGPLDSADTEKITLSTSTGSGVHVHHLSITEALSSESANPVLKTDDILFVKEDQTIRNTSFYMQVGTFVLSVAAFGLLLHQQSNR